MDPLQILAKIKRNGKLIGTIYSKDYTLYTEGEIGVNHYDSLIACLIALKGLEITLDEIWWQV